mmetsp:Transcript_16020/g.40485  ORF Transcript_16020/g.40485 Transcript_16020/m.40485 type:complete len:100 (-) Transcript_16020:35-334(-)
MLSCSFDRYIEAIIAHRYRVRRKSVFVLSSAVRCLLLTDTYSTAPYSTAPYSLSIHLPNHNSHTPYLVLLSYYSTPHSSLLLTPYSFLTSLPPFLREAT